MKPDGERPEHADEHIRQRAHAANDQLRLYFSVRVLSEPTSHRRLARRPAPILFALGVAAVVAGVGIAFGSHLVASPTQRPDRAFPAPAVAATPSSDTVTRDVLIDAESNLRMAASYHVVVSGLTCDSGIQGVAHTRVDADLTVVRNGDLTGTASVVSDTSGPPFAVTRVGGQIYVRGRSLWDYVDPASGSTYGDLWVDMGAFTPTNPAAGLFHDKLRLIICELDGVTDSLTRFSQALLGESKVSDTTFQGRSAIGVRDPGDPTEAPVSVVVVGPPALPAVLTGTAAMRSSIYGVTATSFTVDRVGAPASVNAPSTFLSAG